MMTWAIPAKTFLLGEYSAIADRGAIILTTHPCFELMLSETPGLHGIHPDSPAGRWWRLAGHDNLGLHFHDPYHHCGGMGASSAQFLGAYLATSYVSHQTPTHAGLLEAYWQCAWLGQGLRPSGYDVMAQSLSGCVSLNRQAHRCDIFPWPFPDLAFILLHTGLKLATHHHLIETTLSDDVKLLDAIVTQGQCAFIQSDSQALVDSVTAYHEALMLQHRVTQNTQQLIASCEGLPGLLAMKGCGAMGADVLLFITTVEGAPVIQHHLEGMKLKILATSESVFTGECLIASI